MGIYNVLAELEEIIEGYWDNYGECIEIIFDEIKVKIIISLEDNYFRIY